MATPRKDINQVTRATVLDRDHNACRKCRREEPLEIHHIVALTNGGSNELENLIVLCKYCHSEWENLLHGWVNNRVSFAEWLTLPPAGALTIILANKEMWSEDMTAQKVRKLIIVGYQMLMSVQE